MCEVSSVLQVRDPRENCDLLPNTLNAGGTHCTSTVEQPKYAVQGRREVYAPTCQHGRDSTPDATTDSLTSYHLPGPRRSNHGRTRQ